MNTDANAAPASSDTAAPQSGNSIPEGAGTSAPPAPAPEGNAAPTPAPTPGTAGAAPEGTNFSEPNPGSNDAGSASETQEWTTGLDDDNQLLLEQKGWKDANAALKSYRELSAKLGERVLEPPKADAPDAEVEAFYDKMGRPQTPDQYSFHLPEGVPADVPYDGNFAGKFKNWAHEAGLSPRQASALHDRYVQDMAGAVGQSQEARGDMITKAHTDIVREWGEPETDGYRRNVEMSRRAMTQLDLRDDLTASGIIDPASGMITSSKMALALSRIGEKMFAEDTMYSGVASMGKNPFTDAEFNMTEQSLLIKNDPSKANTLIRAAGQKPEDYGLSS